MLKQKRRANLRLGCWPCHHRRIQCDHEWPCSGCRKRDHPDLCSFSQKPITRRSKTRHNTLDSREHDIDLARLTDPTNTEITVDAEKWSQAQEELRHLRAQRGTLEMVRGCLGTRNWPALEFICSASTDQASIQYEAGSIPESSRFPAENNNLLTDQAIVCSTSIEDQSPHLATNCYTVGADSSAGQVREECWPCTFAPRAHSVVAVSNMTASDDLYTRRASLPTNTRDLWPPVQDHSFLPMAATQAETWAITTREAENQMTGHQTLSHHHKAPCLYQDQSLQEREPSMSGISNFTNSLNLEHFNAFASLKPLTFDLTLDAGPNDNLGLPSTLTVSPTTAMQQWHVADTLTADVLNSHCTMLPDLSINDVSSKIDHPALWNNGPIYGTEHLSKASEPSILRPEFSATNTTICLTDQSSCPTTAIGEPKSDELPIRFTKRMFDTLNKFSTPPVADKKGPHVNNRSHYNHVGFKPQQFSPQKFQSTQS